ncbi:MAG: hypothetical protein L0Y79_02675 [Chlorobi bacterium]|nr:hypothetical protein [Chlorobiota bacterium]MCI0715761.1 hypothetical protein [Chlorobiota bacterium]
MAEENTKEVYSIISANFELQKTDVLTLDEVKAMLASRINDLLDKNVERLLSIIYRIDVSQKKIDEIFKNESKDEIALQIAEAVIQRQLLKVQTRKLYKNKGEKLEE